MLEIETRDLLRLRKQVDGLVKTNSEKEKVIKDLKDLKDNLKTQNVSAEQQINKKRKRSEEVQGKDWFRRRYQRLKKGVRQKL